MASSGGVSLNATLTALAALTTTSYGRSLLTVADAAALRTLAGVDVSGGNQPLDAELTALSGLTSAADKLAYFTGSGTAALTTFTAAGRALVDDADAAAQRTTLGLAIGTDVQAFDADLANIAALTTASFGRSLLTVASATALAALFRLDQVAAPTASVSLNSQKITSLATPTASTDASTKDYVDTGDADGLAYTDDHAATVGPHPGSGVVLTWSGSDYIPTAAKAVTNPKEFRGPTDPSGVSGVVLHQYDVWVNVS